MPEKGDLFSGTPHSAVSRVLGKYLPGISELLQPGEADFHSLRLYSRGSSDVLSVAKRYSAAGDLEVCFGSSFDAVGALLALEGGIQQGRWRADVPWEKRANR